MDVSIIIASWNTRDVLRNCLKSVYEQTKDILFEVIVIDNASSDGSIEMLKADFSQVILIGNTDNRGLAAANNQGISLAKGRYILLLNSDTIILENAVAKTIVYADKHSSAAVVGCQVWENSDTIQMTCFRFPSVVNLFLSTFRLNRVFKHNRILGREWMLWWDRNNEREVDVISGSFMLVRRKVIDEVGLMDEDYFLYYEETDWCYRFAKAGWKMLFWPKARIVHYDGGRNSSKQEAEKMFVQFQKSLLIFFKKHYGWLNYIAARLLLIVSLGLRCCFWILAMLLKQVLGSNINWEKEQLIKHWIAFKFCAFGTKLKKV